MAIVEKPSMKQRITTLFAGGVLGLALCAAAVAGPIEDGKAAYQRGDYTTAIRLLLPLGEKSGADAMLLLSHMYGSGKGVKEDANESWKWLKLSAENGNPSAQLSVGWAYQSGGISGPKNVIEAAKWLQLAADQGEPYAQEALGKLYYDGNGVPKDYVIAYKWLNLAARRESFYMAKQSRDALEKLMTPAQIAEAQRLAREWAPK
ncbi:MAG: tetratricopeptide repeat protein [Methylocystis sp.]